MSKRLVILGAKESGVGAALLAQREGYDVFVSDFGMIDEGYKTELNQANISYEENEHSIEKILNADLVVKSPGVPEKASIVKEIRNKGIELISEIEFASRFTSAKIVAITGSNGKTTTTSLTYHILKNAGLHVKVGGNIGISFARLLLEEPADVYVLEISSFQLDDINSFKPEISILLNITPDHLDRYNYNLEEYAKSKFAITKFQDENDFFIYCSDDPELMARLDNYRPKAQMIPFSIEDQNISEGAKLKDSNLTITIKQNPFIMSIYELGLQGKHNLYNSMAAGIVSNLLELRKENVRESLRDFKSLEHRLETSGKISGIEFINDSKATNVNSTWYALETMEKPIIWIAGGVDKGNDYSVLTDLVKEKVKAIVCLGVDNRKIHEAFSRHVDMIANSKSMSEAVKVAYYLAEKEEVVLLSPACASFDLFDNYEDRGQQFKEEVIKL